MLPATKLLKSPLKLIGGKSRWRDKLYPLFPSHQTYVEPFLGSGTVLIGKEPSQFEVGSDCNQYAIEFFAHLRDNPVLLFNAIHIWKEKGFIAAREAVTKVKGVDKAAAFYVVTKLCMNGIWRLNKKGECNSSYCGTTEGRGFLTPDWADRVSNRLRRVILQELDAFEQIGKWRDVTTSFLFLDPPYYNCKTTYNGISWGVKEYQQLAELLEDSSCRWLLTINDDPWIRGLFAGIGHIISHEVVYSCSQTVAGRGSRPELIIKNY